jgi:hypothetical protein
MALRPFARHPKSGDEEVEETTPDETNEVDQFFSNDRRRRADRPADDPQPPEVADAEPVEVIGDLENSGWYPDASDPSLMRYWDGFHLTGQLLHVHSRADDAEGVVLSRSSDEGGSAADGHEAELPRESDSELASSVESLPALNQADGVFLPPSLTLVGPPATPTPAVPESASESAGSAPDQVVGDRAPADGVDAGVPGPAPADEVDADEVDADEVDAAEVDAAEVDAAGHDPAPAHEVIAGGQDRAPAGPVRASRVARQDPDGHGHDQDDSRPKVTSAGSGPVIGGAAGEANRWAKEAEKAVARATNVGSPETWQEAARIAAVVSEMSQTLQAAAEADRAATQLAEAAREAAQRSRAAAQKSADADRAVQQAQRAAQEATDAAQRARQRAVEAKEAAERASQVVPTLVEAEKVAATAAADAQRKAQSLGEIVGTASKADTPAAWSEALRLASVAVA